MEDSFPGKVSGFQPRRSPRFIKRDAHLQRRHVTYEVSHFPAGYEQEKVVGMSMNTKKS
ncbi:hypothetical protein C5167_010953 [Papaver somniferum]|uniref:Uncharacterized protein n=1 Tax=Papaver somniferum TaxID=3469 RepID=A0A4Y7K364_PAPSO|nr:hypothetical protein C5167_010953 [Papaver somniferum]